MDYTKSANYGTSLVTGFRMHQNVAVPTTRVTKQDLNSVIWELMTVIKQSPQVLLEFDENNPASYSQLRNGIIAICNSLGPVGPAGGSLSGTYPNPALVPAAVLAAVAPATNSARGKVALNAGDLFGDDNNDMDALTSAGLIVLLQKLLPSNALQAALLAMPVPLSTLSPVLVATGNVDLAYDIVQINTAGGAFNVTLPLVSTMTKKHQVVSWVAGTLAPTLVCSGADLIDGAASTKIYYDAPVPGAYSTFKLMATNTGWRIV